MLANGHSDDASHSRLMRTWWALRSPSLRENPPEIRVPELPDYWHSKEMPYTDSHGEEKTATVHTVSSPSPVAAIGYISGWKGDPLNVDERRVIEKLRASGFMVIATNLEHPGARLGTMEDNINRIKEFMLSKDSPLYTEPPTNIPRFMITHSTAALISELVLFEQAAMREPTPNIKHIYNTAPFFDTSGSSIFDSPFKENIYNSHAMKHATDFAGDPLKDRLLYAWRDLGSRLRYKGAEKVPVHGQILEIKGYGHGHLARLKALQNEGSTFKTSVGRTFVISSNDSFASPITAENIAHLSGAEIIRCEADHNPAMNDRSLNTMVAEMRIRTVGGSLASLKAHEPAKPIWQTGPIWGHADNEAGINIDPNEDREHQPALN